jgi:quercetin dioxygenase-like cupin family protein
MEKDFTYLENLEQLLDEIPPDSILSRSVYQDEKMKTILFVFQPGQELSEHTAGVPAVIHFLEGEANLTLGDESKSAGVGTWVHMRPNLPHSICAKTRVLMLLSLFH